MAGRNILIIDDDSRTVNAMVEVLESEDFAAFAASTKKSALELAQKVKPSVIYVNAILTDASGLEITRSIRSIEAVKAVPIVMLTEMEEEFSDRYQATYGIVGFLKKPIDKKELLKKTLSCVQLDDMFPVRGNEAAAPGTAHDSASAGGAGFGEVDLTEGKEKEEHTVPGVEDMDFEEAHESTVKPEPSSEKAGDTAHAAVQEPKQADHGLPQAPIAEKKEVKSPEGHEQLPVPRKPVIPGKPAAKKVEVDENFNPDDLFRDAKKPVIGKKKGLLGPGAARKEERGVKRNLVRNVVIAGIALSSVLVIVYLWFFADFGFRKETVTPPKGTGSLPQQAKSSAPQGNGQRTIVATVPSPPQQLPQPPADSPSDVPATSSGKPTSEKSAPVRALPPQKPALSAPEKSGPARPADKKPAPALAPGYYIQVGYFSVEENAESLYNDLKSKNYSAFIKKDRTKNGIRYRVLVGRYKNKDDAAKALKKISGAEKIRGAIYRL